MPVQDILLNRAQVKTVHLKQSFPDTYCTFIMQYSSNPSTEGLYCVVDTRGAVHYAVQGGSLSLIIFEAVDETCHVSLCK